MATPATASARSARAAETRTRILEAARRVLGEEGPERFTTRRVADLAGVSHGMVHYHFEDKRALLLALLVHARRDWIDPLEELVEGDGTGMDRMRAVIVWMAEPQTTDVMRIHQSLFVFALRDEALRERLASEFARWRGSFVTLFERIGRETQNDAIDARALGETFAAAADALVQEQSIDPSIPTAHMLSVMFERLVQGGSEPRSPS